MSSAPPQRALLPSCPLLACHCHRRCFLGVCRGWQAAMAAAPHLAPPVVVRGPPVDMSRFGDDQFGCDWPEAVQEFTREHAEAIDKFLTRFARMRLKCINVILTGFEDQVGAWLAATELPFCMHACMHSCCHACPSPSLPVCAPAVRAHRAPPRSSRRWGCCRRPCTPLSSTCPAR